MNKIVIAAIIIIIIIGIGVGYSIGNENQDTVGVNEQVEITETPQGRNITIELSDGLNIGASP